MRLVLTLDRIIGFTADNASTKVGISTRPTIVILGPFTPTLSRSKSVLFTSMIDVASYYTIVLPLQLEPDILSFGRPLSSAVWVAAIISVPVYVLVMSASDHFFCGVVNWEANIGFVLRNTLSEHSDRLPDRRLYQKVLVFFWAWHVVIIVQCYAGNLTSMITSPKVRFTPADAEQMLQQAEVKWAAWDGSLFTKVQGWRRKSSFLPRPRDEHV